MAEFNVYYPIANQIVNRSNPAIVTDSLRIVGSFRRGTSNIEAKWGGGSWVTIAENVRGFFDETLAGCGGVQTLSVRPVDYPLLQVDVAGVGIGDVFAVIGQSNASGRGDNNQAWSGDTTARNFANDYTWKTLADPADSATGQIDNVSADAPGTFGAAGSIWPLVATQIMTATGCPVAFIVCPKGATYISAWQPGAAGTHQSRSTLFGQFWARVLAAGGNLWRTTNVMRCALWWQGEGDQFDNTQAGYNAALDTLANTIATYTGAAIMPQYKLQYMEGSPGYVDAAVAEAVVDNDNVLLGPDLSAIIPDTNDGLAVHIKADANLAAVATLWANAIKAEFGWD